MTVGARVFRNAFHFPEIADPDEAGRFPGGQSGVKVLAFILGDEPIFTFSFQKFSVFQFLLLTWLEFFWNSLGTLCVSFCDTGVAGKNGISLVLYENNRFQP